MLAEGPDPMDFQGVALMIADSLFTYTFVVKSRRFSNLCACPDAIADAKF